MTTIKYTENMISDLRRCQEDPIYFIETFCKYHSHDGVNAINLYPFQKDIIKTYHTNRFVSAMCARQSGKSLVNALYMLWYACVKRNQTIMSIAPNTSSGIAILDMVRFAYFELPEWLRPDITTNNKNELRFENGSRIVSRPATVTAARGMSVNLLCLDEMAYYRDTIAEELWRAVYPTVMSTNGEVIMTSTYNTQVDMFCKLRENADNWGLVTRTYTWQDIPGRDEVWRDYQIAQRGYKNFYKEFECTSHTINELYREIEQLRYELKNKA